MTKPVRLVAVATIAYAAIFSALGADRYATYHSGADLGLFAQTIASAFHGFRNTFEGGSHFAYHFSPILYLCAPLLWLAHSAIALIVIQAAATSLVAPALYCIGKRRTSEGFAAAIACIALLYPPLQGVTFTDFHEVAFVPAAAAWLLWALDARRFGVAYALVAVLLCVKEDQAPAMAWVGLACIAFYRSRNERSGIAFGIVTIVASILIFAGYFAIVRPMAGSPAQWRPEHFYAWKGYAGALPLDREIVGRLTYLLEAFIPLAFLPLRSRVLVLSLPGFVEVLASREPLTYTMGQHYAAVWIPYVLVAYAVAAAQMLETSPRKGAGWLRAAGALCVFVLIFFSPLHLGHFLRPLQPQDAATAALTSRVPADASIGTYDEIYAHLGFFPNAQVGLAKTPEYVLMDERYSSVAWNTTSLPVLDDAVRRGIYAPIANDDDVILYRRR